MKGEKRRSFFDREVFFRPNRSRNKNQKPRGGGRERKHEAKLCKHAYLKVKFSGNEEGRMHQMPSVSSSKGRPICLTHTHRQEIAAYARTHALRFEEEQDKTRVRLFDSRPF